MCDDLAVNEQGSSKALPRRLNTANFADGPFDWEYHMSFAWTEQHPVMWAAADLWHELLQGR